MNPDSGLWALVCERTAATPDARFAIDHLDREISFRGYRDAAVQVAGALEARGIGVGSRVSWQLPTTLESLVLAGALARLGANQNPILPMLREREVGFILGELEPELFIVPGTWRGFDHEAMANELTAGSGIEVVRRDALLGLEPRGRAAASGKEDWRWSFYSSGTTADPKGARHSDPSVGASGVAMAQRYALEPSDRVAMVFPVTHIGGIGWLFTSMLVGCSLIVEPVFDPVETPARLAAHGVTQATAGTVFHQAYLAAQRKQPGQPLFRNVRSFPGGGAPKPPRLHHDIKREMGGAGIVSGYGMTEFPIAVLGAIDDADEKLAHTEGRATEGVDVKIAGADGSRLGAGEEGEIRLKGPQCMLGYVDGKLDAAAFDAEGFLRSGDLGRLDAEGHLIVTGRLKDVIVRKGENISARQVEDLLFDHPAIADVAVIGIPDPAAGEIACAVAVLEGDTAAPELQELSNFLDARGLSRRSHPERLEVVSVLPRNASGKVLKNALRERFATGS
ncbi:MAG: AMP-binding protein [Myxococcota bacterium]|nr:AMP-binding protein [Myxococcota bacterium]